MPLNRRPDQSIATPMPGSSMYQMMSGALGSKMMTVGDLTLEPGVSSVYHVHPNTEESIFVAEGEVEFRLDGPKFRAKAGGCMVARRGVGEGSADEGDGPGRLVGGDRNPARGRERAPARAVLGRAGVRS